MIPRKVNYPNFEKVEKLCEECISNIYNKNSSKNEMIEYAVFDCVMEAYYGKDIWDWIYETGIPNLVEEGE